MSVEIDPLELAFRRPFTVEVAQILRIKNPNTAPVAFKVKTTAPKQYCVRPNSGRIEPGHEVEVSVLLQAMKQEPPLDAKCRDKFLVQSVTITGDKEFTNVSQIWDAVEKSAIQEKKIRVAWLPPSDEGRLQPAATPLRRPASNGVDATPDTAPPAYSSPHEDTTIMDDTAEQPMPKPQPRQQETPEATQQSTQSSTTFSAAVPPAAAAAVASTIKSAATAETYDDLRDKLAQAEATIASLKKEMAGGGGGGGGLRQRKGGVSDEAAATGEKAGTQQQLVQAERQPRGTEGVPVQVVALLCLVSFLLAYFFF